MTLCFVAGTIVIDYATLPKDAIESSIQHVGVVLTMKDNHTLTAMKNLLIYVQFEPN